MSARFRPVRTVVCNSLISFVRLVVRLVKGPFQIIRPVVWKVLKMLDSKIRTVFLLKSPIPPTRARAREIAPHAERRGVEARRMARIRAGGG